MERKIAEPVQEVFKSNIETPYFPGVVGPWIYNPDTNNYESKNKENDAENNE